MTAPDMEPAKEREIDRSIDEAARYLLTLTHMTKPEEVERVQKKFGLAYLQAFEAMLLADKLRQEAA